MGCEGRGLDRWKTEQIENYQNFGIFMRDKTVRENIFAQKTNLQPTFSFAILKNTFFTFLKFLL